MDAEVWAALIAAIAALIVALLARADARRTDREAREQQRVAREEQRRLVDRQAELGKELEEHKAALAQRERAEERALTAEAELDRVREPLLLVALDLGDRLNNIRNHGFLGYLSGSNQSRQETAAIGTLYRFTRYWCVVESLYDRADLGKLRADSLTRDVATKLNAIGSTFADDRYDEGRLMVWREEQRAIAERARDDRAAIGCIGFASFVDRYDTDFARWFDSFRKDLPSAVSSERLRTVQRHLAELAERLAPEGVEYYRERIEKLERGSLQAR